MHNIMFSIPSLSYSDATAIYRYDHFGRGYGGIFLDNLHCTGDESRLIDCRHNGIGVHNCDHTDDAGVRCRGIHFLVTVVAYTV